MENQIAVHTKHKQLKDHKIVLSLILVQLPVLAFIAPIGYGTGNFAMLSALFIGILAIAGFFTLKGQRAFGALSAVLLMLISASLIESRMGEIEMHFHIFVALAFLLIFKDWLPIVVGAAVIAVHHLILTYLQLNEAILFGIPVVLYNYGCSWGIFITHALFVVVEAGVLIYYSLMLSREHEVSNATANAIYEIEKTGNFSIRIPSHQDHETVIALNTLLGDLDKIFNTFEESMSRLQKGDFSVAIKENYKGDLKSLSETINKTSLTLDQTMHDINSALNALEDADFSRPIHLQSHAQGAFKQAVDNAINVKEILNSAVSDINKIAEQLSDSQFNGRIETSVTGDLLKLKGSLNSSMESMENGFNQFNHSLNSLLEGDLTTQVNGNYSGALEQLQKVINQSIQNLSSQFNTIKNSAQLSMQNVNSLNDGNRNLIERSSSQTSSILQTSQTMQEVTDDLQHALQTVEQTDSQTRKTQELVIKGSEIMRETRDSIEKINESSSQISEIVTLIEGIAFQTNLLALNAAVEAARAGEHGRGFAVVASEVRALAQKSADAAKEISSLIGETTDLIHKGSELSRNTSDQLDLISDNIQDSTQQVSQMRMLFEQQVHRVAEINQSMVQINHLAEQNMSVITQMQSANNEMSRDMSQLVENTSSIKTLSPTMALIKK